MNQRQDNPLNWTDGYVAQRFARVVNFHTHTVDPKANVNVSSQQQNGLTTYLFSGKRWLWAAVSQSARNGFFRAHR